MQTQFRPADYEVEFLPIERRLFARRKSDRDPRQAKLRLTDTRERRRQERRQGG